MTSDSFLKYIVIIIIIGIVIRIWIGIKKIKYRREERKLLREQTELLREISKKREEDT